MAGRQTIPDEENYQYCLLWVPTNIYEDYKFGGLGTRVGRYIEREPPRELVGYFFINNPFRREELWNDLRLVYEDELQTKKITMERISYNQTGLACRMKIRKKDRKYFDPLTFDREDDPLKQSLDALKDQYLPDLNIRFDEGFGYYRAKIARSSLPDIFL